MPRRPSPALAGKPDRLPLQLVPKVEPREPSHQPLRGRGPKSTRTFEMVGAWARTPGEALYNPRCSQKYLFLGIHSEHFHFKGSEKARVKNWFGFWSSQHFPNFFGVTRALVHPLLTVYPETPWGDPHEWWQPPTLVSSTLLLLTRPLPPFYSVSSLKRELYLTASL